VGRGVKVKLRDGGNGRIGRKNWEGREQEGDEEPGRRGEGRGLGMGGRRRR